MDNFRKYFKSLKGKRGATVSEEEIKGGDPLEVLSGAAGEIIKGDDPLEVLSGALVSKKELEEIRKRLKMK